MGVKLILHYYVVAYYAYEETESQIMNAKNWLKYRLIPYQEWKEMTIKIFLELYFISHKGNSNFHSFSLFSWLDHKYEKHHYRLMLYIYSSRIDIQCTEHQYNLFHINYNRRKVTVVTFQCKLLLLIRNFQWNCTSSLNSCHTLSFAFAESSHLCFKKKVTLRWSKNYSITTILYYLWWFKCWYLF